MSRQLAASDGVRLHDLEWFGRRSEPPWAVVVFLHGIASHAGWFARTADHLHKAGPAVYARDRRGSGRSEGRGGHLDRYARARRRRRGAGTGRVRRQETPVFVAASSWAAKLAVVHAALRHERLAGLLLLGPGLLPSVELSPAWRAAVVAGQLAPPTARIRIPLTPGSSTPRPRATSR